jgi:ATP-dependent helicase YprA (DUF1998 family)
MRSTTAAPDMQLLPSDDILRALVAEIFKKRACRFQMDIARFLQRKRDVIAVAATGLGKTLSFWMYLLYWKTHLKKPEDPNKLIIVVTPLNILGEQNEAVLRAAGISGVAVDGENMGKETLFQVCRPFH